MKPARRKTNRSAVRSSPRPKADGGKGRNPFITRAEARRRAGQAVIRRMFKGALVRDGVAARLCIYDREGKLADREFWVVYKNLGNDSEVIEKLLPDALRVIIGKQFFYELKSGPIIYWNSPKSAESQFLADPNEALMNWMIELTTFFQALWLVNDHAVSSGISYCIYTHPEHGTGSCWNAAIGPVTATGMRPTSVCSVEALSLAREYFSTLFHITFNEIWLEPKTDSQYKLGAKKGVPRLFRFHDFLSTARHANDLAVKISHYMTCLEVLFSTGSAELTYKLSERVAFFLAKTPAERKIIFQTVKNAYSFRSKLVHGDVLEASKKIQHASEEIDKLLRRLLLKILEDEKIEKVFQKSKDDLDDYLTNLTLGCS